MGDIETVQRNFVESIKNFRKNNESLMNDSNRKELTAQNEASRKIQKNSRVICEGIQHSMLSAFGHNKISQETSTIVKNIGLKNEIESLGLSLLGHIDFVIIDAEGNLSLYNYKMTSESLDSWKQAKL
mgnify:CR=1 FL=1